VPIEAAHASLKHLQETRSGSCASSSTASRTLRGRLLTRQQKAAQEGVRAREALAKPFKHTEALAAAERKLEQIEQQMRRSQAQEVSAPPSASTDDVWPGPGTRVPPPTPSWTPPPLAPRRPAAPLSTVRTAPSALRVSSLGSLPGDKYARDALSLPNRRAKARNRTRAAPACPQSEESDPRCCSWADAIVTAAAIAPTRDDCVVAKAMAHRVPASDLKAIVRTAAPARGRRAFVPPRRVAALLLRSVSR
jgi:hypothetical protein